MADSHVFRIEIQRDKSGRRQVIGFIVLQSGGHFVFVTDQKKTIKKRWITTARHTCDTVIDKVLTPEKGDELTLNELGDFVSFTFNGPAKYEGARFSYLRTERKGRRRAMGDWDAIDEGSKLKRRGSKSSRSKSRKKSRRK